MGTTVQVAMTGLEWRENRRRSGVAYKDKEEWIAGPVPGSGILRKRVDAARAVVAGYRSPSEPTPTHESRNHQPLELRFCALLMEGGTRWIELARA